MHMVERVAKALEARRAELPLDYDSDAGEVERFWAAMARTAVEIVLTSQERSHMTEPKRPKFRCDNCGKGVELEWEYCAWCGATKDWLPDEPIEAERR